MYSHHCFPVHLSVGCVLKFFCFIFLCLRQAWQDNVNVSGQWEQEGTGSIQNDIHVSKVLEKLCQQPRGKEKELHLQWSFPEKSEIIHIVFSNRLQRAILEMWTFLDFQRLQSTVKKMKRRMRTWRELQTLSWAVIWSASVWKKTQWTATMTTSVSLICSKSCLFLWSAINITLYLSKNILRCDERRPWYTLSLCVTLEEDWQFLFLYLHTQPLKGIIYHPSESTRRYTETPMAVLSKHQWHSSMYF